MITNYLQIAGFTIAVKFQLTSGGYQTDIFFHQLFRDYFRGFICENKMNRVDYTIILEPRTKIDVITNDKQKKVYTLFFKRLTPKKIRSSYDIGVIQFSLLLREILQELLAKSNGFILHGSAAARGEEGIIFSGKSGAGKSTVVKLLAESMQPLADDMVIIRKISNRWYVFQTPFFEKNYLFFRTSKKYKLRAILVPQKSQKYFIQSIPSQQDQFRLMVSQLFSTSESLSTQMASIQELIVSSQTFFGEINFSLESRKKVVELVKDYDYKIKKQRHFTQITK